MKNNKRKKKTRNKKEKFNYIKYCIIIIIIVLLGVGVYFFLTSKDDETNLTVLEKQWIVRNKKTLIDIDVPNNLSILADNGKGVVFDYLKKIEKDTELGFNKKSYNYMDDDVKTNELSILVLSNEDKIDKNDLLLAEDDYVLISKTEGFINNLNQVYNKKIGILKDTDSFISDSVGNSFSYTSYDDLNDLISSLEKGKINYAIVPRYYSLEDIVKNNLYINYSFKNLTNKIVLHLNSNKKLSSIMSKYLELFKSKNDLNSYENEYMDFYIKNTDITEVDTSSLSSKVYTYGYVKNNTYNMLNGNKLYGYAGEYMNMFSKMANIEFEYKEYQSSDKLKDAIKSGEVDVAFIDFDYSNEQGLYTVNSFDSSMLAISGTNYPITLKEGLENRNVYVLENSYLNQYLKDNYNIKINTASSITEKALSKGIFVLDEGDYYYNQKNKDLGNYYVLLKDTYQGNYKYFVKNSEQNMYDFIDFMLNYTSSDRVKINSINNLVLSSNNQGGFANTYLTIVLIIIIPIILCFIIFAYTKARKHSKLLHKEDVLKYNDMMTSLKNRNYLRAHIDEWDEMKITPRTIIIADLNNLKYINDNYGQEEGNILIKKAAAILINTQLEKSEIIRTDGNEFLIYLIGYNKTQVNTYIGKLSREFEKLPHGFGAAIGYSMIEDEIKTIDDAINEASIEMRMDKEQNYK